MSKEKRLMLRCLVLAGWRDACRGGEGVPYVRNTTLRAGSGEGALRGRELGVKATSDLDSILSNPEIKVVTIAAINSVHAEQTIRPCAPARR